MQEKLKETITEKEEVLKQVADMKKGKEKSEAAFIEKEEKMKEKVKTDMKKYEEAIEFLNKELSQMTVESEGSLIADLRRGMSGSSGVKHKGESSRKRERECVMCLSEERSVIFIPCAHEVLCVGCNEAHKNQGMRDCPSCRAPIVMRLKVRFSHE